MSTRDDMLERIKSAVAQGKSTSPVTPIPRDYATTGTLTPGSAGAIELLVDRLIDYKAEVHRIAAAQLPDTVAQVLGSASSVVIPLGLPADVHSGCERSGARIVIDGEPDALTPTELDGIDVVVTAATVAIAVTGTIILDGSAGQGRRAISLVPDRHVVVLRADHVVETVPEALRLVNPQAVLTLISGPSATSDIELERVEGVHGPRTLQVLIVD